MSGLEVVAAGAGFIALGLQLCDYSLALRRLYHDARSAPQSIQDLASDLNLMGFGLQQLEQEQHLQRKGQHPYYYDSNDDNTLIVSQCLETCRQQTGEICRLVDEISARLARYNGNNKNNNNNNNHDHHHQQHHKKLLRELSTTAYAFFKERDVQDLVLRLERSKATLTLAYMACDRHAQRRLLAQGSALAAEIGQLRAQSAAENREILRQLVGLRRGEKQQAGVSAVEEEGLTTAVVVVAAAADAMETPLREDAVGEYRRPARTRRERNNKAPTNVCFRLPLWLSSRVWSFSLQASQTGFTMKLSTYNIISRKSAVYSLCENGDLEGIRRLIANGEASPLDCVNVPEYNSPMKTDQRRKTLLEVAAEEGHMEVCRYFLEEATYPDQSEVMSLSLSTYARRRSRHMKGQRTYEGMYKLFVENAAFDREISESYQEYWLASCRTFSCLQVIANKLSLGVEFFSSGVGADVAFHLTSMHPREFLTCTGMEESDPKLATMRSSQGGTILHYVALRIHDPWLDEEETLLWGRMAVSALKQGTDPHKTTCGKPWYLRKHMDTIEVPEGATPLMALLSNMDYARHGHIIRTWAEILYEAGIDLCSYAETEIAYWERHDYRPRKRSFLTSFSVEKLIYGPLPSNWGMTVARDIILPVYEFRQLPGGFEHDLGLPKTIFWDVEWEGEETKGGYWDLTGEIHPFSIQRDMTSHTPTSFPIEPIDKLVRDTQDDASIILLMCDRENRGRPKLRRSLSQPPDISRMDTAYLRSRKCAIRAWLPRFHKCPWDMTWRINCACEDDVDYFDEHFLYGRICDLRKCILEPHTKDSPQEHLEWWLDSFLGDARRCRDGGHMRYRDGRLAEHTGTIACPLGCGKFDMNRLNVPKRMMRQHPWSQNDFTRFGLDRPGYSLSDADIRAAQAFWPLRESVTQKKSGTQGSKLAS